MSGFEFNSIRYLTFIAASISLVVFLACNKYLDINTSIFSLNLVDNITFYLRISSINFILIYYTMKRSAISYFYKAFSKANVSGMSKQAINIRNNFISILSEEALYFSIGKTNIICIIVLIISFFLPINNLYWLYSLGSILGSILCYLIR